MINDPKYKIQRLFTNEEGFFVWHISLKFELFKEAGSEPGVNDMTKLVEDQICKRYECNPDDFEVTGWYGNIITRCLIVYIKIMKGKEQVFLKKISVWVN